MCQAGDMKAFEPYFKMAKENDLRITLHIAEVCIQLWREIVLLVNESSDTG